MTQPEVYIQIENNGIWELYPARSYQKESLNNYIDNNFNERKEYKPCYDIKFWIKNFDENNNEKKNSDFYYLEREDGTMSIISRNKEKLQNYIGWRNRITL
jgi:hypothetical protein